MYPSNGACDRAAAADGGGAGEAEALGGPDIDADLSLPRKGENEDLN